MIATFVRIRSWQWALIGIAIGVLGAASVGLWGEPLLSAYGDSINGKRHFEEALTRTEGGRPRFTDLQVHAEELPAPGGGKRTVHVVSGMQYRPDLAAGSQLFWRPAFYVAEVPYHPAIDLAASPAVRQPRSGTRRWTARR